MSLEKHLKNVAWTGAEIGVTVLGGIVATKVLDDRKIFKDQFAKNPSWFEGPRDGAPIYIKWSGGLKAGAAITAASYIKNPWAKLFLFGIAYQGVLQQARILTWDKEKNSARIGASSSETAELDKELRNLAKRHRTMGTDEMSGEHSSSIADGMEGPEYVSGYRELGDRYQSSVAGYSDLGDRYKSAVAGAYDEDDMMGFSFQGSDSTSVGANYEE